MSRAPGESVGRGGAAAAGAVRGDADAAVCAGGGASGGGGGTSGGGGALRRDLALVLPELRELKGAEDAAPRASVAWKPAALDEALAHAVELIDASTAPAVVGLQAVTLEAARTAVLLAERMRGRLVIGDGAEPTAEQTRVRPPRMVTQTASLGHVFASDLIVWVGCTGTDGPIAEAIASRQLLAAFLDAELETALRLRADAVEGRDLGPLAQAKRAAAVLAPEIDERVASQWHRLAADLQERVRLSVFELPAQAMMAARGAAEVIAWQTGVNVLSQGGVDFGDGAPRACSVTAPADVVVGVGVHRSPHLEPSPPGGGQGEGSSPRTTQDSQSPHPGPLPRGEGARVSLISIGPDPDPPADVAFPTPGLALGLAARVMRCDGVILWLCEDPAAAPPDPAATILHALAQRVRTPA